MSFNSARKLLGCVRHPGTWICAGLILIVIPNVWSGPSSQTASQGIDLSILTPRVPHPKSLGQLNLDPRHFSDHQLIVKFKEGTNVRLRDKHLVVDHSLDSKISAARLAAAQLTASQVKTDLDQVSRIFASGQDISIQRLISGLPETKLAALKSRAESRSKKQLADLDLYFDIRLSKPDGERVRNLVEMLSSTKSVEVAYPQPIPANAAAAVDDIPPTTTIDLRTAQGYKSPAPNGIDVPSALAFAGGRGEQVKILDVEFAWELDHEDLPSNYFYRGGVSRWPGDWNSHGTAVLGELAGLENKFGVTGIAPKASFGVSGTLLPNLGGAFTLKVYNVSNAIILGASAESPGDLLQVEQHLPGPSSSLKCSCNCKQFEYVPVEYFPDDFDAISYATSLGLVVVEAGGNGSMNLDGSWYGGLFDTSNRDSGAILVGAGDSSAHAPECFSNFGSRLDVQGWGDTVATLGYGGTTTVPSAALRANGDDDRQWYTRSFSGTSSATPIVTGAAALIQSIRKANGFPALNSVEMRGLLTSTGTPQGPGSQIGPLPNLLSAINATVPDKAIFSSVIFNQQAIAGSTVAATLKWSNGGPHTWNPANYHVESPSGSQFQIVSNGNLQSTVAPNGSAFIHVQMRLPNQAREYDGVVFNFVRHDSSGNVTIGQSAATIQVRLAGSSTQDSATLSAATFPTHIIYSIEDNERTAQISVHNTGQRDWTANSGFRLKVSGPGLQPSNPIVTTIDRNTTVQLNVAFRCSGSGNQSFSFQMQNPEGQPFGNVLHESVT